MTAVSRIEPQAAQVVAATPMDMLQQAVASGASVELMERLLTMQERWEANAARKAFNAALTAAMGEIPAIVRTAKVERVSKDGKDAGVFRHETMQEIARVVNPILSAHGLSYRFRTDTGERGVTVTCVLMHEAGHQEENSLTAPFDTSGGKNNVQGIGSTQTYLQRYTLKAALGLAVVKDDDGKGADDDAGPLTNWLECISECGSVEELRTYFNGIWAEASKQPKAVMSAVVAAKDARKAELTGAAQ